MPIADNPRAVVISDAFKLYAEGFEVTKGLRRLVFDQKPQLVRNQLGEAVGVEVMVRLFVGLDEIHIDPHRVIINPPTVPRANLTYEEGSLDANGKFVGTGKIVATRTATKGAAYRRIVGAPDPQAALIAAIWDSIERVPNAEGWRTRGTVTTVFATAPGGAGRVRSDDFTYATARTGGTLDATASAHTVGQILSGNYFCYESFIQFDTSGIPDGDTVSAVTASLYGSNDFSTTDFTAKLAAAANYNGGVVVTTDWESGANLNAKTLLATWASSGYLADYNAFTETADFKTAINKVGDTLLILFSDRHADGTTPTGAEYVIFFDADAAGTTTDPKLDITHAAAGGGTHPGWFTSSLGGWWHHKEENIWPCRSVSHTYGRRSAAWRFSGGFLSRRTRRSRARSRSSRGRSTPSPRRSLLGRTARLLHQRYLAITA